jgi:uncharacterized membrane protein YkoI
MIIGLTAAAVLVAASNLHPVACKEALPGLQAQARVSCVAARKKAMQTIGGKHLRVVSAELEEESGRLVYSFDIARRGRPGVEEIQVDARSGEVVSARHESAKDEAAEKD